MVSKRGLLAGLMIASLAVAASTAAPAAATEIGEMQAGQAWETVNAPGEPGDASGLGPEIPISFSDIDHHGPAVASNWRHDEYLVVYTKEWSPGRTTIEAQRVSTEGGKRVTAPISTGSEDSMAPAVAYNAFNDEYLVVWMYNASGDGSTYEIWGKTIAWDFSSQTAERKIVAWANRTLWTPRVAWNSAQNQYLVVWNAFSMNPLTPTDVAGARVSAEGNTLDGVHVTADDEPHQADVTYNVATGDYLVVWRRMTTAANGDIMAARVAGSSGAVVTPPGRFFVNGAAQDQRTPAVTTNYQNRYVVVWEHAYPGPCCDWDIRGQELDVNGDRLGIAFSIADSSEDETRPTVVARPEAGRDYLVTYQRYRLQGEAIWAYHREDEAAEIFEVEAAVFWDHQSPAVAWCEDGALMAYTGDSQTDPSVYKNIYGRIWASERPAPQRGQYDAVVVGMPGEEILATNAGAAHVLYGTEEGVSAAGNQLWSQASQGMLGGPEEDDAFGSAVSAGDFNSDGRPDLAVGVPGEDPGGLVQVLYGTATGLSASGNQIWSQGSDGMRDDPEPGDGFGQALATGDFDGDGYADLAVGVPHEDPGGLVQVIYGTSDGLSAAGNQIWSQGFNGIRGSAEAGDLFGAELASGDFDADGYDDLVVSATGEDTTADRAGIVHIIYGSPSGLLASGNQLWDQNNQYLPGVAEENDRFGLALATGDLNGDGFFDLAVSVPYEDSFGEIDIGIVHVLYGTATGLRSLGNQAWHQNQDDMLGGAEASDQFGQSLGIGDFDGDTYADLAVGVMGEEPGGLVQIIYGTASGLSAAGNQIWYQDKQNVLGTAEVGDLFGYALTTGSFNGDRYADLAVGVPGEDTTETNGGLVQVFYGSAGGISAAGDELWDKNSLGVPGKPAENGFYGTILTTLPRSRPMVYLPLALREYGP